VFAVFPSAAALTGVGVLALAIARGQKTSSAAIPVTSESQVP
jgi:hypothetical protein